MGSMARTFLYLPSLSLSLDTQKQYGRHVREPNVEAVRGGDLPRQVDLAMPPREAEEVPLLHERHDSLISALGDVPVAVGREVPRPFEDVEGVLLEIPIRCRPRDVRLPFLASDGQRARGVRAAKMRTIPVTLSDRLLLDVDQALGRMNASSNGPGPLPVSPFRVLHHADGLDGLLDRSFHVGGHGARRGGVDATPLRFAAAALHGSRGPRGVIDGAGRAARVGLKERRRRVVEYTAVAVVVDTRPGRPGLAGRLKEPTIAA